MTTKCTISIDLEVRESGGIYYLYDSHGDCITKSKHLSQVKKDIVSIFENSLGLDVEVSFGKSTKPKAEPLKHEGMHL